MSSTNSEASILSKSLLVAHQHQERHSTDLNYLTITTFLMSLYQMR